jgi:hypothetical protein
MNYYSVRASSLRLKYVVVKNSKLGAMSMFFKGGTKGRGEKNLYPTSEMPANHPKRQGPLSGLNERLALLAPIDTSFKGEPPTSQECFKRVTLRNVAIC